LRCSYIPQALFYHRFVRLLGIQLFVECLISIVKPLLDISPFFSVCLSNRADLFTLLWRQIQLTNGVAPAAALLRFWGRRRLLEVLSDSRGNGRQERQQGK
jgi:hypothetical protein